MYIKEVLPNTFDLLRTSNFNVFNETFEYHLKNTPTTHVFFFHLNREYEILCCTKI